MNEPELVAAARAGDRRAFRVLVDTHYARLVAMCRRAAGDADLGEDAAQEAVVAALLGLDELRRTDRFGSWLFGIGLNVCRRQAQERDRLHRLAAAVANEARVDGAFAGPEEAVLAMDAARRVRAAIAELPPGQRHAVADVYLRGLSYVEAAAHLAVGVGAVKTRLHKARATLRPRLTDLWKEYYAMPTTVLMRVADLRRTAGDPVRHVVFLAEVDGARRLPIWIGAVEATALAAVLEGVELPRPGPYHFAASLLTAAGTQLSQVRINALNDSIFYAQAVLVDDSVVDARPSDALTLALLTGASLHVEESVLERAEHSAGSLPELFEGAASARDDARVLAQELRAQLATNVRERDELEARTRRQTR